MNNFSVDHIYENIERIDEISRLIVVANYHFQRQEYYKAAHCLAHCLQIEITEATANFISTTEIIRLEKLSGECSPERAQRFICYAFLNVCVMLCRSKSLCKGFYETFTDH